MPQGLEEGKSSYQGRSWFRFGFLKAKNRSEAEITTEGSNSAEVIVATSNEPLPKINRFKVEALQGSEGLNIKQLLCRIDPPIGGSYQQRQQERKENKNLCKQLMQC